MTEMLAALLGAIVGGGLSAWVGSWQTAKVLKHETELAADERQQAQLLDLERRRSFAADQLIAALADFTTVKRDDRDSANFVRLPAVADVHRERSARVSALMQAGASHAHALPDELRLRWNALTWMVRFNQSAQIDRSEGLRRRDVADLLNYVEYVRRSLCAVAGDGAMPQHFPPPNVRRDEPRVWGFKPKEGSDEPDLTDWWEASRHVGRVTFETGDSRWYGPNGIVEDNPDEDLGSRDSHPDN